MPKYPAQIDTTQSLPTAVDNLTPVQGLIFNKLRDAVLAIESELGVKPSATYSSVKARIDNLETIVGNLRIIELDNDLGGTLDQPLVIGIQGRPVSTVPPQQGEVYVWDGLAWSPMPQSGGGGGGGITPGGDLAGGPFIQTVIGLQNRPIDTTAPTPFQSLIWNGTVWKPGFVPQDLMTPPVDVILNPVVTLAEVNQTLTTPAFTASYTATPSAASLEDDVHNTPQNITSTPTSFNSSFNFIKTSFGDTVTFTLTATQGPVTKSDQQIITWGQRLYWGVDVAGQTGASFITGLSGQQITLTKQFIFAANASSLQKVYFACRTAYGDVVFTIHDIEGGFTKTQTVPITNAFGFTENYDLYESNSLGLGSVVVTTGNGDDEILSGINFGLLGGTVIYDPGAFAPIPPVYNTFGGAYAAVVGKPGSTIVCDASTANPVMTAGTYDLTGLILRGHTSLTSIYGPNLYINDGVIITHLPDKIQGLFWNSTALSPVFTASGGNEEQMIIEDGGSLAVGVGGTGTDWINVPSGQQLSLIVREQGFINGVGVGQEVIKTAGHCDILLESSSGMGFFAVATSGLGDAQVSYNDTSIQLPPLSASITKLNIQTMLKPIQVQLTNGSALVLPFTAPGFSATSSITISVRTYSPGTGNLTVHYAALDIDRSYSGLGSFQVKALKADGTLNLLDNSLLDVIVVV